MNEERSLEDPSQPAHPLIEAARRFASLRNRSAAIYFLPRDEPLGTPNTEMLVNLVGDRTFDELDLVIRSSGGDIHAAYQLVCFLKSRAKRLNTCVPHYARSAATLLCVGADSIVLDELAALGPLDTQVYVGFTDSGRRDYVSALNPFKNLERLRDFSLETLRVAAEILHEKKVGPTADVLKYALKFVTATSTPLFGKVEAHKLGDYSQTLAIGEEYGHRLLQRFHTMDPGTIESIIHQLVHGYPAHEYVIDCHELQELGFEADVFAGEERVAARALRGDESTGLIMLVDPHSSRIEGAQLRQPVVLPVNPWRASQPRIQGDLSPSEHRAWAPPGPPIYDPPPWEESPPEHDTSDSEDEGETE